MPKIFFPFIERHDEETAPPPSPKPPDIVTVNARGFGIGVRSQSDAPDVATIMRLLNPPVWYNWWFRPRGQSEAERPYPQNYYPMIWNPGSNLYCWPQDAIDATSCWWFIGNEPVNPQQRNIIVYPPDLMANQARAFHYATGRGYGLCGEYLDAAGIAYCRELQRLGCVPDVWLWHIYPESPDDWLATLHRAFSFDPNRPIIITETALWNQPPAAQRKLMDRIAWALDEYPQLWAVLWYDSYDAAFPPVSLLTAPGPNCQLTETGKHYLNVIS